MKGNEFAQYEEWTRRRHLLRILVLIALLIYVLAEVEETREVPFYFCMLIVYAVLGVICARAETKHAEARAALEEVVIPSVLEERVAQRKWWNILRVRHAEGVSVLIEGLGLLLSVWLIWLSKNHISFVEKLLILGVFLALLWEVLQWFLTVRPSLKDARSAFERPLSIPTRGRGGKQLRRNMQGALAPRCPPSGQRANVAAARNRRPHPPLHATGRLMSTLDDRSPGLLDDLRRRLADHPSGAGDLLGRVLRPGLLPSFVCEPPRHRSQALADRSDDAVRPGASGGR